MEALQLARQENFNGVTCDFYNRGNEFFMTRNQIGTALKYDDPIKEIDKIHSRHKERLDKFSTTVTLGVVEGSREVTRERLLYSQKGIFEICRWSKQPKADEFMDWVWDVIESYINGKLVENGNKVLIQKVNDLSDDFKIMCQQVNSMENAFDKQFVEFKEALKRISLLLPDTKAKTNNKITLPLNSRVVDPIRDTIKPLAELYGDKSVGYNNTYRKVYAAMEVNWKYRQSRYKNIMGNKKKPSKIHLLELDKRLLSEFTETVGKLIAEAGGKES
jgi:prophage antirepressor-like protein